MPAMPANAHSHFFAYLNRLRWIKRWGLKRNAIEENVMEHSWEVAVLAHALAVLRNRYFGGELDAHRIATAALFHDATEVITGDMPSPVKYHSAAIREAYKAIERSTEQELLALLPPEVRPDYAALVCESEQAEDDHRVIKAADTLAAYLKCKAEILAGNREFEDALRDIEQALRDMALPEVDYFLEHFAPSYGLTLDRLLHR